MDQHPVECPCRELHLQSIAHERMAQRLSRIHRLLKLWEEKDQDDYNTLLQIQRIVSGLEDIAE